MSSKQIPDTNEQLPNDSKSLETTVDDAHVNQENTNMNNRNYDQGDHEPATVDELLKGITTFLETIKSSKSGGNAEVIETERKKVSKLFNILSVEDLLNHLELTSNQSEKNP
jgi:hypothetical protein